MVRAARFTDAIVADIASAERGIGEQRCPTGASLQAEVDQALLGTLTIHPLTLIFRIVRQQMRRYPVRYAMLFVFIFLTASVWIAEPLYARYAIDRMLQAKSGVPVDYVRLFLLWGALFVLMSAIQTTEKFTSWKLSELLILDQRERLYAHVLKLGISFHTRQKSGEVIKIVDNAADTMADLQRELIVQFVPSFLSAIVFLVIGFVINPLLAVILVCSISLFLVIAVIGTYRTRKLQEEANRLWVTPIGRAYDAVTNIYSVKSGAQEGREEATMHATHVTTFRKQQQVNVRWAMVEAVNFFMLTRILLISIGIYLYTRDVLTLGEVYFFQSSFFRVLTPFEMLGGIMPQWNKRVGRVRLADEILTTPLDVTNKEHPVTLPDLRGEIRLENVCFAYAPEKVLVDPSEEAVDVAPQTDPIPAESDDAEHVPAIPNRTEEEKEQGEKVDTQHPDAEDRHPGEVLHDVNLTIRPGEHIAFVGHSGAGKTTLAMLLNRFYDVTGGRIVIDGVDLRDVDVAWWRSQIGLVLQENIMFNDSILENIRYARPDATIDEVREAAARAAAHEFIETLPNGYHTLIGDRGIRLSGGQRQRVAIARAILKRPKLVVLDEATSALDSVTEKHVQEGIRSLIEGRTACIIAHRLSTVRSVDRIAVFDEGKLIDVAPHEELMKRCDIYREMVELQSQGMLAEE